MAALSSIMTDWSFQARAVEKVLRNWCVAKEGCLVAPTGAGKTNMAAMVIKEGLKHNKTSTFLSHTRDLVDQTAARLHRDLNETVGVVMAGRRRTNARVQVSSIQTLVAREAAPDTDIVLPDECHHMAAREWSSLLQECRGKFWLGLTATPERGDGLPLGGLFRWLVVAASYSDLVRNGNLVPCRVYRPQGLLKGLADDPVAAYLQWGEGRSGFVYVKTVEHARALALAFSAKGIPAAAVDFESPDRAERIADLREGRVRLLINVYTLTEGVDVPAASICIIARGVGHVSVYLQMAGRVLRAHPGKTDAVLLDLPGVTHDFGMPTEDREYSLEGEGIRRAVGALAVKCCQKCGLTFPQATLCPRCGFRLPEKAQRIYGVPLGPAAEVSEDTKRDEWARLQALAIERGYSDAWATKVFREKYGSRPVKFSDERRKAEYEALKARAAEKGYSPGWAAFRYKATYGAMPPRAWQ